MGVFSEVKLFQVKPSKVEGFESLMATIADELRNREGCQAMHLMKRFYVFDDVYKPPRELTRIVKCVKYYSYWEFDSMDNYALATQWFFDNHAKEIMRLLIMPFDINCGETIC